MTGPFDYQQELLNKYKDQNEDSVKILGSLVQDEVQIVMEGRITGSHVSYATYWLSDGRICSIVEPASLGWVPMDLIRESYYEF